MDLGYVPIDREPEAASKTVEYAYDDWTIARMAERLGKADVAAQFDRRAGNWSNTFDTHDRFVRARKADGTFREPFDPDRHQLRIRLHRGQRLAVFLVRAPGHGRPGTAMAARQRRSPSWTPCSTTRSIRILDTSRTSPA